MADLNERAGIGRDDKAQRPDGRRFFGLWRHLDLIHDGATFLRRRGFDVWVCTKPLEVNPTCRDDKGAWIEEHFPELLHRLIITPDKSMVRGDVLIDDAPKPEWFPRATWYPLIFDLPFNRSDPNYVGLPRFEWHMVTESYVLTALDFYGGRS